MATITLTLYPQVSPRGDCRKVDLAYIQEVFSLAGATRLAASSNAVQFALANLTGFVYRTGTGHLEVASAFVGHLAPTLRVVLQAAYAAGLDYSRMCAVLFYRDYDRGEARELGEHLRHAATQTSLSHATVSLLGDGVLVRACARAATEDD